MTSLTVQLPEFIKHAAQKKAKEDGVTLTFVVTQALKAYEQGTISFGLIPSNDEVTASFDISTEIGKAEALRSFTELAT